MKWARSIRFKLASAVTCVVVIVLALQMAITTNRHKATEQNRAIAAAKGQSALAIDQIIGTYTKNKDSVGLELVKAMRTIAGRLPDIEYFQVIDMKGNVAFDSRSLKHSIVKETITNTDELAVIQSSRESEQIRPGIHSFTLPYFDSAGAHTYSTRSFVSFAAESTMTRSGITQLLVLILLLGPLSCVGEQGLLAVPARLEQHPRRSAHARD